MSRLAIVFRAFIVPWFRRFCDRFSTYELCQPQPESAESGNSEVQPLLREAVCSEAQPIHISPAAVLVTETRRRRRRHGGLGNGFDQYVDHLRATLKEGGDKFTKDETRDYRFKG